ncbi:MAG: hypothetical protein J6D11_03355 [Clostridia bacterium]|nr:hypothetical protein [Clostridia bacterium]
MQNNGEPTELSQKYCGSLACNVTLLHTGTEVKCLSSHLCHPDGANACDHRMRDDLMNKNFPHLYK